jgi:F-type H+-transporting ATPase subunit b
VVANQDFLIPNGTFIIELILFLLVLGIIRRYVLPPLTKVMSERQEQLRRAAAESEESEELLRRAEQTYRAKIDEARQESRSLIEQATRAGEEARAEMAARAKKQYDQAMAAAAADIERAARRANEELAGQVADLVADATARALGRPVDPELRQALAAEAGRGAESHV